MYYERQVKGEFTVQGSYQSDTQPPESQSRKDFEPFCTKYQRQRVMHARVTGGNSSGLVVSRCLDTERCISL